MAESPDVVRFPVQIAESICCFVIFVVLIKRAKSRNSYRGSFGLYMFLYAVCRFVLEFFRGDEDRGIWLLDLSTSQITALLVITACGLLKIIRLPKKV